MKKSELRRLIAEYNDLQIRLRKSNNQKTMNRIKEIKQRYFHETGNDIDLD